MTIYIIAALLPAVLQLFLGDRFHDVLTDRRVRRRKVLPYLIAASVPMLLILGLRGYYIGTDTIQYVNHFKSIAELPFSAARQYSQNEPILYLLMWLCSRVSTDPTVFLCVDALIVTAAFISFVSHNGGGELQTLFFHVTLGSFFFIITGMRQGLAISFCLLAVDFARRRKPVPFALLILLAFYTHRSAIMFALVYIVANKRLTIWNLTLYAIASVIFIVFLDFFQGWFNNAIDYGYDMEETGNGGIFLAVVIILTLLSLYMSKHVLRKRPEALVLYNMSFIALVFWVARLFTRTAERPSYYFLPATFAVVSLAIDEIDHSVKRTFLRIAAIVLSLCLMIYRLNRSSALMPFIFFWEG